MASSVRSSENLLSPIPAGAVQQVNSLPFKVLLAVFASLAAHLTLVLALCFVPKSLIAPKGYAEANFETITIDMTFRSSSGLAAPSAILASVTSDASHSDANELPEFAEVDLEIESTRIEQVQLPDSQQLDRSIPKNLYQQTEYFNRESTLRRPPANALPIVIEGGSLPQSRRQLLSVSIEPKTSVKEFSDSENRARSRRSFFLEAAPLLTQVDPFNEFGKATKGEDDLRNLDSLGTDTRGSRQVKLQPTQSNEGPATNEPGQPERKVEVKPTLDKSSREELSLAARVTQHVNPYFPAEWVQQGIYGDVLLIVFVNERGTVDKVEVFKGSGYEQLDRSAVAAVKRWKFQPAKKGGRPIAYQGKQMVQFFSQ